MSSIAPPSHAGCIKGLAFREFLHWYGERHGRTEVLSALRLLPASQRELFDSASPAFGVVPSAWYPCEMVHRVLDRICVGRTDAELEDIARRAALPIMRSMMTGAYSFAFSTVISPARWIALRQYVWDMYYDTGRIHSEMLSDTEVRTWFNGWLGHHRMVCKLTRASNLAIYEAMGLKNVEVELTRCVSKGDADCEVRVHWTPGVL